MKKLQVEPFYATFGGRGNESEDSNKRNNVEGLGIVNKCVTQNWFQHFKGTDTRLQDKPMSRRPVEEDKVLLGLVWFYSISTIVGYLMPNPFLYIYIKYMISKHIL